VSLIAAQEKIAQKAKNCLMARTLNSIMGYMFSDSRWSA